MVGGLVVGGRFLSAESWASDGSHELFVSKSLASGPPGPSQPVTARAVAHLFPQLRPQIAEADGNRTRPPSLPGALVLKTRRATRPQSPPGSGYLRVWAAGGEAKAQNVA